ncbi:response regulator transcription factor [Rhodanobacter caeni]|uniref:Response regulator transcription factor n=1 Tax=Rhodanobacter caeni TaxID=657654 RepID=A0ABP3E633_9GAMM
MRIVIADDHQLIAEGARLKLAELGPGTEFTIALDIEELRQALRQESPPALALIDLTMPGVHGREHLSEVITAWPGVPVIVLSGAESPALIRELLAMGVQGFIPKAYSADVMLSAVRLVLSGGVYVPPMMLQADEPLVLPPPSATAEGAAARLEERLHQLLTERQLDVLRLLSKGKPNKVIASELGISEGTVKIHLAAIFRALNVRNRVEAVVASRRIGEV